MLKKSFGLIFWCSIPALGELGYGELHFIDADGNPLD